MDHEIINLLSKTPIDYTIGLRIIKRYFETQPHGFLQDFCNAHDIRNIRLYNLLGEQPKHYPKLVQQVLNIILEEMGINVQIEKVIIFDTQKSSNYPHPNAEAFINATNQK